MHRRGFIAGLVALTGCTASSQESRETQVPRGTTRTASDEDEPTVLATDEFRFDDVDRYRFGEWVALDEWGLTIVETRIVDKGVYIRGKAKYLGTDEWGTTATKSFFVVTRNQRPVEAEPSMNDPWELGLPPVDRGQVEEFAYFAPFDAEPVVTSVGYDHNLDKSIDVLWLV